MNTETKDIIKVGNVDVELDKFYTTDQLKGILGVGVDTIRARVNDGSLVRSQIGRIIFYKGRDIINFLEKGRA